MTSRTKAGWLFGVGAVLIAAPYVVVFAVGSVWMWRHGLIWYWAVGTGVPTFAGLLLVERARRILFPPAAALPHPPPAATPAGRAAAEAVQAISRRFQDQDLPLDQPEALERLARETSLEVLEAVARHFHPQEDRPALEVPVTHVAALVELVARDFRRALAENVPWGNRVTLGRLLWWKEKGKLAWPIGTYAWQINRIRRLVMRPATAMVQEVQDQLGQNLAMRSVSGLKRWAIDYCVTKAGDYAIQLYSGGFVLDDERRGRVSAPAAGIPFGHEPLQVLVVGQVKSGKSSLVNALLGEVRAAVDALPATDAVDLYECQPDGLPPLILRDTPGYGATAADGDAFSRLRGDIEQCDLLLMVCTARSAARNTDCKLLRKVHEFYQREPSRMMPPVVYLLTHIDTVPAHLAAEPAEALAADFGVPAAQVTPLCGQWGRLANREGVVAAIREKLPEAELLKTARCIRQIRKERDEDRLVRQIFNGVRLAGGWIAGKR
jgi:GTP-binding protein EngB required for normal cell division